MLKFLCQEILTQFCIFLGVFGTGFANASIVPKSNGTDFALGLNVSRCSISTYDEFAAAILM